MALTPEDHKRISSLLSAAPESEEDTPWWRMPVGQPAGPSVDQNRSALGDVWTDVKMGVARLPGTLTGIADIPFGLAGYDRPVSRAYGAVGEAIGFTPGAWGEEMQAQLSPQRQAAEQRVEESRQRAQALQAAGDTTGYLRESLTGVLSEPRAALGMAVQSAPEMVAGGLLGRGLLTASALTRAGVVSRGGQAIARGGVGEGLVMAGHQMKELAEEDISPQRAATFALGTGVLGGAIGVLGGAAARRMGVLDPDVLVAGGGRVAGETVSGAAQRLKDLGRRVVGGIISEGVFEEFPQEYMEAVMGNLAAGRPAFEGAFFQGVQGAYAGGVTGGAINVLPPIRPSTPPTPPPRSALGAVDLFGHPVTQPPQVEDRELAPVEDLRSEYQNLAVVAQQVRGNPDQLALVTQRMEAIRKDLVDRGAPVQLLSSEKAIKRVQALEKSIAKLEQEFSKSLEDSPAKATETAAKLRAAQAELQQLAMALDIAPDPQQVFAFDQTTQEQADAGPTLGERFVKAGGRDYQFRNLLNSVQEPSDIVDLIRAKADTTGSSRTLNALETLHAELTGETLSQWRAAQEAAEVDAQGGAAPGAVAGRGPQAAREGQAQAQALTVTGEDMLAAIQTLTAAQREYFTLALQAAQDPKGLNRSDVADMLGISRQAVADRERRARRRIEGYIRQRYGLTAEQARAEIANYFTSLTVTETATETRLGESPAEQDTGLGPEEFLDEGFGTIASAGASQVGLGEDVEATQAAVARPDPVAERRAQEARARHEANIDRVLATPDAAEAAQDWDDGRTEFEPTAQELGRQAAFEWVLAYMEWKNGERTEEALASEQREIAAQHNASVGEGPAVDAGSLGVRAEQPAALEGPVEVTEPAAPAAPIESRVEALRPQLSEAQQRTLDRLLQRFANPESPDFDLTRLETEVDTLEERASVRRSERAQGSPAPTTPAKIRGSLKPLFFSNSRFESKVVIVQSVDDLLTIPKFASLSLSGNDQAFVDPDTRTVYMIAENIDAGQELAVFLHEIGVHLGMPKLLGQTNFTKLSREIAEWSTRPESSLEGRIARAALARLNAAAQNAQDRGETFTDSDYAHEMIAYFVEEAVVAGVDPTALGKVRGPMLQWFRTLWAAVKQALRAFGIDRLDKLTAQNIVDIAYGAARMELEGTFHGTAADFRRFDSRYMGSGEGAQAFGWGHYLAQRPGIAETYWWSDIRRKAAAVPEKLVGTFLLHPLVDFSTGETIAEAGTQIIAGRTRGPDAAQADLSRGVFRMGDLERFVEYSGMDYIEVSDQKDGTGESQTVEFSEPEGAFMHVDIAFGEDEMLDWDKPLSEQSEKVQGALENVRIRLKNTGDFVSGTMLESEEDRLNASWGEFTGKDLIGHAGMPGVLVSAIEEGVFPEARDDVSAYQAASEYLDSIGVKGIKFLDAVSRDKGEGTNNIVVFNDKNIVRVASQIGGPRSDRMRFSQRSVAEELDQTEDARPAVRRGLDAIGQMVESAPPEVRGPLKAIRNAFTKFTHFASFTHDFADMVEKYLPNVRDYYDVINRRIADRTREVVSMQKIVEPVGRMALPEQQRINRFLLDMAFNEEWGFQPDWVPEAQYDPESATAKAFQALPEEQQRIVQDIFRKTHEMKQQLDAELRKNMDQAYTEQLERVTGETVKDRRARDRIEKERTTTMAEFDARNAQSATRPYLPLKRWGKLAVVAKSQAFLDAVRDKDNASVERMKSDVSHYRVMFTDNHTTAERTRDEWVADGFQVDPPFSRMAYIEQTEAIPFNLIQRLRQQIREDETKASSTAIANALDALYIQALDETSIRKTELHRRKVHGFAADHDMVKAFVEHGESSAHMLAALRFNQETLGHLQQMRERAAEPGAERNERMLALNEVLARHANSLTFDDSALGKLQGKVLGATSIWMLLSTPSYYMQNATQPFMLTLPHIAGKHGYARSFNALVQSYQDATKAWRKTKDGELLDPSQVENEGERATLTHLRDAGLLDIGITADMGSLEGMRSGLDGAAGRMTDRGLNLMNRAHRKMLYAARTVEMYNRTSTALTAYRLEYQQQVTDGASAEQAHARALDYAVKEVQVTQGNYSTQNAPRLIASISAGRLLFQFRKFQLIQIGLLARVIHQSFAGATSDERAVGWAQARFLLAHHLAIGGVLGLPAMNLLGPLVAGMMGEEDEPKDFEVLARRAIGNKDLADLLLKGVPARMGVDTSQRLGMGQTFSLMPFTDIRLDNTGYDAMVTSLLGPAVAQGRMIVDGVGLVANGNPWQGYTQMLPRGLRDAIRAYREKIAGAGLRNRRDETMITADELSFLDAMLKGIGWPTSVYSTRWMAHGAKINVEQHFRDRSSAIQRKYVSAYDSGDTRNMQEAREAWQRLQDTRKEYGFQRQPMSNLIKAPRERTKREKDVVAGVPVDRSSRQFVESLL